MQTTHPRLYSRRPATRASALLQPLAPFLALLPAAHASGQDLAAATKPKAQAPVTMTVCESGNRCSDWTFRGKMGSGVGPDGQTQVLAIERADDKSMTVHRTDMSGATAGLTAEYAGRVVGDRIEGSVTSSWPGHWTNKTNNWSTTISTASQVAPLQIRECTTPGHQWCWTWTLNNDHYDAVSDNGNTAQGAIERFTPGAVSIRWTEPAKPGYWSLSKGKVSAEGDRILDGEWSDSLGQSGHFVAAWGQALRTLPLASHPIPVPALAQQNRNVSGGILLEELMRIALGGGGGSEESCAERTPGTGRCVSQSEANRMDAQRHDSAERAQRSANP